MHTARCLLCTFIVPVVFTSGCGTYQDTAPKSVQAAEQPNATKATSTSSIFSPSAPSVIARPSRVLSKACAADKINDSPSGELLKAAKSAKLKITGWAVDDIAVAVPAEVFVELVPVTGTAHFYAAAARLTKRPDVAKAHGKPVFENSGYDLDADLSAVPAGVYSVLVVQPVAAGVTSCDTKRRVDIR